MSISVFSKSQAEAKKLLPSSITVVSKLTTKYQPEKAVSRRKAICAAKLRLYKSSAVGCRGGPAEGTAGPVEKPDWQREIGRGKKKKKIFIICHSFDSFIGLHSTDVYRCTQAKYRCTQSSVYKESHRNAYTMYGDYFSEVSVYI